MDCIVDISTEDLHLGVYRGFLTITKDSEEIGRVALDDIGGLITHAHGLTWSNTVFVRLSERNVPVVICAPNHAPVTCLWPIEGHHIQGTRMRAQAGAKRPLKKQAWQKIVAAKICNQGAVLQSAGHEAGAFEMLARKVRSGDPDNLEAHGGPLKKQAWQKIVAAKICNQGAVLQSAGHEAGAFEMLARKVRSGDPDNLEAQAARRYWPMLMGEEFRRNRDGGGINGLLNYGYTVLRAIISRAICAAGLHPTLAIHHSNQGNAFALADDLMEPYRPLVDRMAFNLTCVGKTEVDGETKQALANLGTLDLDTPEGTSPLNVQASRLVHSLATSFTNGSVKLDLPRPPAPLVLAGLGLKAE